MLEVKLTIEAPGLCLGPGPAGRLIPAHPRLMMAGWAPVETPSSVGVAGTRRLRGRSPPR